MNDLIDVFYPQILKQFDVVKRVAPITTDLWQIMTSKDFELRPDETKEFTLSTGKKISIYYSYLNDYDIIYDEIKITATKPASDSIRIDEIQLDNSTIGDFFWSNLYETSKTQWTIACRRFLADSHLFANYITHDPEYTNWKYSIQFNYDAGVFSNMDIQLSYHDGDDWLAANDSGIVNMDALPFMHKLGFDTGISLSTDMRPLNGHTEKMAFGCAVAVGKLIIKEF